MSRQERALDLRGNELKRARFQELSVFPITPAHGQMVMLTSVNPPALCYWDGTVWRYITSFPSDPLAGLNRVNHTGVQLSATISDLDTVVRSYRLDQFAIPVSPINVNSQRLTSVLDPTSVQDAATKHYVDIQFTNRTPVEVDLGNGSATSFTIDHNFGTRAVTVLVYRATSPYDEVDVYVERPTVNSVTLKPNVIWTVAEFHVVVAKM